jgi:hypothetical protein
MALHILAPFREWDHSTALPAASDLDADRQRLWKKHSRGQLCGIDNRGKKGNVFYRRRS